MKPASTNSSPPVSITSSSASREHAKIPPMNSPAPKPTPKNSACSTGLSRAVSPSRSTSFSIATISISWTKCSPSPKTLPLHALNLLTCSITAGPSPIATSFFPPANNSCTRSTSSDLDEMLSIAENSSASRIEFAHVQYYGWAFANRDQLLPTREQLMHSLDFFKQTQERLRGKIKVEYVVPDYYAKFPKPCMGGWARKAILITPSGAAMPCHAASVIPGLRFDNVKEKSVKEIWKSGEAFQKFRGEDWMHEPCKSCDRRQQDFGGCRCQAFLLAGDAAATDPVCSLSPQRSLIDAALAATPVPQVAGSHASPQSTLTMVQPRWLYRTNPR